MFLRSARRLGTFASFGPMTFKSAGGAGGLPSGAVLNIVMPPFATEFAGALGDWCAGRAVATLSLRLTSAATAALCCIARVVPIALK